MIIYLKLNILLSTIELVKIALLGDVEVKFCRGATLVLIFESWVILMYFGEM